MQRENKCKDCNGTGKSYTFNLQEGQEPDPCFDCNGTGKREKKWQERFDEKFRETLSIVESDMIKHFIQSEIDTAIAEEMERTRTIIKNEFQEFNSKLNNL